MKVYGTLRVLGLLGLFGIVGLTGLTGCDMTTQRDVVCGNMPDPGCEDPFFADADACTLSECDMTGIYAVDDYEACRAEACEAGTDPNTCDDLLPDCA